MLKTDNPVVRPGHLAPKIVMVDGQPGCGKTMLSPIIAALDRVELLTYAYELEYICELCALGKMTDDAAVVMTKMLTDLHLYNNMMGRGINFRPTDISSVWRNNYRWQYLFRILQKGDEAIPQKVKEVQPILHLTTHNLMSQAKPLFEALKERLVIIEVVRHPLYMIKQQALNFENIVGNVRDFTIYFEYQGQAMPFYVSGWEELYLKCNGLERAVYSIDALTKKADALRQQYKDQVVTIVFEDFVLNPDGYMQQICQALGTSMSAKTLTAMKKQKVPRQKIADGLALNIYKRCGWQPPQGNSEEDELRIRRDYVAAGVRPEAVAVMDDLCYRYEEKYLGGRKVIAGRK